MHLALAVGAQVRKVQPGKVNALFAARAQDAHVSLARGIHFAGRRAALRRIGHAVKHGGAAVAARHRGGVVAGGDGQHVFKRAGAKLGKAVHAQGAGVGHQDELGPFQHQKPRAFGKFPVIADHGAHLHGAAGGVQRGGVKIFAARKGPLCAEIAGVHLCIQQPLRAEAVEQGQRVARAVRALLQKSDGNGHLKLFGKRGKALCERAVRRHGLRQPPGGRARGDDVADAPHFREQREVCAKGPGFAAGGRAPAQVFLRRAAGGKLQKRKVQNVFHSSSCAPGGALFLCGKAAVGADGGRRQKAFISCIKRFSIPAPGRAGCQQRAAWGEKPSPKQRPLVCRLRSK